MSCWATMKFVFHADRYSVGGSGNVEVEMLKAFETSEALIDFAFNSNSNYNNYNFAEQTLVLFIVEHSIRFEEFYLRVFCVPFNGKTVYQIQIFEQNCLTSH